MARHPRQDWLSAGFAGASQARKSPFSLLISLLQGKFLRDGFARDCAHRQDVRAPAVQGSLFLVSPAVEASDQAQGAPPREQTPELKRILTFMGSPGPSILALDGGSSSIK